MLSELSNIKKLHQWMILQAHGSVKTYLRDRLIKNAAQGEDIVTSSAEEFCAI